MKHIIILGDGMADLPVERLGGKTLLQYANKPMMDQLAREGRCGRLITVPEGFPPGSEVANTAILGYDLNKVYEGRMRWQMMIWQFVVILSPLKTVRLSRTMVEIWKLKMPPCLSNILTTN